MPSPSLGQAAPPSLQNDGEREQLDLSGRWLACVRADLAAGPLAAGGPMESRWVAPAGRPAVVLEGSVTVLPEAVSFLQALTSQAGDPWEVVA